MVVELGYTVNQASWLATKNHAPVGELVYQDPNGNYAIPTTDYVISSGGILLPRPVDANNVPQVSVSGSLTNLGLNISTTGLQTPQTVPNGVSGLRLNIWGTGFDVKVQGQMYDGVWNTLTPTNTLTGIALTGDITTVGWYDFDIAQLQKVVLNVVSATSVNAQGGFMP